MDLGELWFYLPLSAGGDLKPSFLALEELYLQVVLLPGDVLMGKRNTQLSGSASFEGLLVSRGTPKEVVEILLFRQE